MLQFDTRLLMGPLEWVDREALLRYMAGRLVDLGYAKPSYVDAVVARENEFPTGLPTNGAGVAIPHCDTSHILRPALSVAILSSPIPFGVMGGQGETVPVDIVIMLALNDPSAQIDVLRQVSNMVQDGGMLNSLKVASTHEEVIEILRHANLVE